MVAMDIDKEDAQKSAPEYTVWEQYLLLLADIKQHISLVEKGVATKESRYINRVLRQLPVVRRKMDNAVLTTLLREAEEQSDARDALQKFVPVQSPPEKDPEPMAVDDKDSADAERKSGSATAAAASSTSASSSKKRGADGKKKTGAAADAGSSSKDKDGKKKDGDKKTDGGDNDDAKPAKKKITEVVFKPSATPEVLAYLHLLALVRILDNKDIPRATECSDLLVAFVDSFNRRTMDELGAKAYFYFSRCHEVASRDGFAAIRTRLLAAHRTAVLRHNEPGQATLINVLLRNYLEFNLYDQADKLVSKATFPESSSNNEYARYLYYVGRIKSVQLDYTDAHRHLLQAIRKSPQITAVGFRLAAHKLACLVQLLMGDIPERAIFHQDGLTKGLAPYLELTQTVRDGDLAEFKALMEKHHALFCADRTYNLVLRLRHNVIKTGLRKINISYSRISFADICQKLHLDSPEDAEGIVSKAIRDGVIDAVIDHDNGWIRSQETIDAYATHEPQAAFHKRITFCLNVHNEAVKAMRFPPEVKKKPEETEAERRERERQEEELAKSLADDEEDDEF